MRRSSIAIALGTAAITACLVVGVYEKIRPMTLRPACYYQGLVVFEGEVSPDWLADDAKAPGGKSMPETYWFPPWDNDYRSDLLVNETLHWTKYEIARDRDKAEARALRWRKLLADHPQRLAVLDEALKDGQIDSLVKCWRHRLMAIEPESLTTEQLLNFPPGYQHVYQFWHKMTSAQDASIVGASFYQH